MGNALRTECATLTRENVFAISASTETFVAVSYLLESQSHQHCMHSFYAYFILTEKIPMQIREKLRLTLSCKKAGHKMLMKLTPRRTIASSPC